MKTSDSYLPTNDRPTGRHLRSFAAIAALGLGVAAGYHCGHSSRDSEVDGLHAVVDNKSKQLEFKAHQLEQAQKTIDQVSRSRRGLSDRLRTAEEFDEDPSETQCIDVVERALNEQLNFFTGLLGITNQSDIEKLRNALRKGYAKLTNVSADGSQLCMTDPDASEDSWNNMTFVDLEESVEHIPEEYLSDFEKVEKSAEELEMEQKIADGDIESVITDSDLESLRPENADPNSEDAVFHQAAVDLQHDLNSTTDPEQRAAYFCDFFGKLLQYELSQDPTEYDSDNKSEPMSPAEIQKARLLSAYLEAVQEYVGIEDEEVCMPYMFNRPQNCPPCPE